MKIERCPCCGSMLEVSQSDEQTSYFIAVNGPEINTEIESLRGKLAAEIKYQNEVSISLAKQVRELRGKLAAAEEQIKHESAVNAALSKQSQEYWQDRENAAEYNRELTEKLALSEASGASMREALLAIQGPIDYCDKTGQNPHEPEWIRKKVFKALASPHGKAYLDVAEKAEGYRCLYEAAPSDETPEEYAAKKLLFDAIDRLPGRKGGTGG